MKKVPTTAILFAALLASCASQKPAVEQASGIVDDRCEESIKPIKVTDLDEGVTCLDNVNCNGITCIESITCDGEEYCVRIYIPGVTNPTD